VAVGCSSSFAPTNALPAARLDRSIQPDAFGYKTIWRFNGGDGSIPQSPLLDVNGQLYGTTTLGGEYATNAGTVFALDATGKERVLHSFGHGSDGLEPLGNLVRIGNTLYGTTAFGGTHVLGTVFALTLSGRERVLHNFSQSRKNDGFSPYAGLTVMNGLLYGTTKMGGKHDQGTVFSIDDAGNERIVYSFTTVHRDGDYPLGGLIVYKGALYGTTSAGGCRWGTVFSVTPTGKETVIYRFACRQDRHDGKVPDGTLTEVNGTFYGTADIGGGKAPENQGTVFSVTPNGNERVLHTFGALEDGANPYCTLLFDDGVLYGTTIRGGADDEGTIFSVTQSGKERVLHSFGVIPDGEQPDAGVVSANGRLYGTAAFGGGRPYGQGTVFEISP
jgi:uncharacterized repeat protein (TIGR03803 family)